MSEIFQWFLEDHGDVFLDELKFIVVTVDTAGCVSTLYCVHRLRLRDLEKSWYWNMISQRSVEGQASRSDARYLFLIVSSDMLDQHSSHALVFQMSKTRKDESKWNRANRGMLPIHCLLWISQFRHTNEFVFIVRRLPVLECSPAHPEKEMPAWKEVGYDVHLIRVIGISDGIQSLTNVANREKNIFLIKLIQYAID